MMEVRDFPTYGEMFAIEHAARRAQAAELSRLIGLGLVQSSRRTRTDVLHVYNWPATEREEKTQRERP